MSARPQFELLIQGEQAPASPYTNKVCTSLNLKQAFTAGVADNQFDTLYAAVNAALGTSATESHDLQTALDALGVAMTLTDVCLLYIKHDDASLASSISVQANAVNGLTNLLSTTANLTLSAGDFLLVGAFVANNLVVGAANKIIDVINDDGSNVASYSIEVWGRK